MEWNDQGIVLGVRHHGETSVILELMTRNHGRHLGLVRGGRSRKLRPVLQPGNLVNGVWRARLDEHLGFYQIESEKNRAASLMTSRIGLFCVQVLAMHLRLLPERDPHSALYDAANIILDHADNIQILAHLLIRFELVLLEELGFGLNLQTCIVSGADTELIWVSPKSGCAVSKQSGQPWKSQLLHLPEFLAPGQDISAKNSTQHQVSNEDLQAGFKLTGHFLNRHVYVPRALKPPSERQKIVDGLG